MSLASPFIVALTEPTKGEGRRRRRRELKAVNISKDAFGHMSE